MDRSKVTAPSLLLPVRRVAFTTGFTSLQVDLTSEIQDAIAAGYERLTLRLEAPLDSKEILVRASSDPTRSNPALQVRPSGLVGDLINERGQLVRSGNRAVTDLRDVDAGTYFLRVRRPDGDLSTEPIQYSLIVDAPTLGASHPTPDRDRIFGGDGDDRLVGGAELDALFGGSGRDSFAGENVEIFDLDEVAGESITLPTSGLSDEVALPTDVQVLVGSNIDPNLRAGIARALGHPVTVGFDGNAVTHRPIFASEMAELRRLNLAGLGIADLTGLEHASGLTFLDLSDNQLTEFDLPVEFRSLRVLDVSGNQIESLTPADLINAPNLERLFAEGNRIRDLSALAGVTIIDNRQSGYTETAGQWQSEVFDAGAAWLDDYRFAKAGGVATYTFDVADGETVEVFATWPAIENGVATNAVYRIDDGASVTEVPVLQSIPPQGEDFAGRPWLSLGTFSSANGTITVTLEGTDGAVSADAVRVEAMPKTTLESIYLAENPLNDVTRDELVDQLGDHGVNVFTSPNPNRPELAVLSPVNTVEGSLSFDDQVVVLPREVLHGATSFIAEFWLKADLAQHSTVISGEQSDATNNEFFYTLLTPNSIRIAYNGQAGLDFTVPSSITESLDDSQWHHHAVVVDDVTNRISVYIDGQSIGSQTMNVVPLSIAAGGLVLGQEQDNVNADYDSNQALYGELDELRIWNDFQEGASTDQIERWLALNMDRTVSPSNPSLRAYYQFNGLGNTEVVDSSINNRNGFRGDATGEPTTHGRDRRKPTALRSRPRARSISRWSVVFRTTPMVTPSLTRLRVSTRSLKPTVTGSTLRGLLSQRTNLDSTRIEVTATDELGRQDRTSFDLNVSGDSTGGESHLLRYDLPRFKRQRCSRR